VVGLWALGELKVELKKRMTVSLDEKLVWHIRNIQMDRTLEKNQHVSFSNVVNSLLYKMVKNEKMFNLQLNPMFARNDLV